MDLSSANSVAFRLVSDTDDNVVADDWPTECYWWFSVMLVSGH